MVDCARTGDLAGTVVFARTVDFVVMVDFRNGRWTSCLRYGLRRGVAVQRCDGAVENKSVGMEPVKFLQMSAK
ncbi:hypothetical protein DEO72_LG3g472 [Vigna unguiculata]|uniref:Uncharacterized protein n=1 Tax=Vigna unguiculata TaxID=3917 RepID=A0A4D6LBJ9_VIGUN|nr:hypothetical protein DEO72_LG3g472 [Vigna unguiculata]